MVLRLVPKHRVNTQKHIVKIRMILMHQVMGEVAFPCNSVLLSSMPKQWRAPEYSRGYQQQMQGNKWMKFCRGTFNTKFLLR